MQIYSEIALRREAKPVDRGEISWRIRALTNVLGGGIDLTERANREAFSDVLGAYVPDGFGFVLVPSLGHECVADLDRGGRISFCGLLVSEEAAVAQLARSIWLDRGVAKHHRFYVVPRYRGNRIAPRSFVKCIALYDALGIEEIHLRAAHSGSWYWAQWGFHFADETDLIRLRGHTQEIVDAFGAGLDVSSFVHPQQFFRLGHDVGVTFADLIEALPHREDAYEDIAYKNGIGRHQPIPFGRAVLLTGPSWDGCLALTRGTPDRLIFDDVAGKMVI